MTASTSSPAPRSAPDDSAVWDAPTVPAGARLSATVEVPGSKSQTNRFLVLAALADGPSTLTGALRSRDTDLMAEALRDIGIGVEVGSVPSEWHITPGALAGPTQINCGLAGTIMRFLPAVAALADGDVRFDGDAGARVRPMGPILDSLRALNVSITTDDGAVPQYMPFTIAGRGGVVGGSVDVDASASSQFVSGLLLAAPRFERGLTLRHVGPTLPSIPHIDMTVEALRGAGVTVDDSRDAIWQVSPGPIQARDIRVEPDLSNAGPFLAAALITGGSVSVPGWPTTTTQPGAMMVELLTAMGATTSLDDGVLTVTGTGAIRGIDIDLHMAGELSTTIAALATLADSPSRLRGIAHLRGHETDRLAALSTEINRLGGQCEQTSDGLVITPRPLHGAIFETYHDHRMATAGTLIGLRVPGVQIRNVDTVAKTMPEFTSMWTSMLGSATTAANA